MLKDCKYNINGTWYSLESILKALDEAELEGLNSMSDILYSKYLKRDSQEKLLNNIKVNPKETKETQDNFLLNGDISESGENGEIPLMSFLTQHNYAFVNGERIVRAMNRDDYRTNEIKVRTDEGYNLQDAEREVDKIIENWEKIAEDSKLLHKLITDPIITVPENKSDEFIVRAKSIIPKSSRLYDDKLLTKLYNDLKQEFYLKIKGTFPDSTVVRNLNITSKLKNIDLKLFGHIDYAIIDQFGTLHIYNFKVTHTPTARWSEDKIQSYKYEQAFLKQMLANNGINIKNIDMNIVPLELMYDKDYNVLGNLIVRDSKNYFIDRNTNYIGKKFDNDARYFIEGNVSVENITNKDIETGNNIVRAIFPFVNIQSDVIGKSVDNLIASAPTIGESEPLIIREDSPGEWKVFINQKLYPISDPTYKDRNKEIKKLVQEHLGEIITDSTYINNIKNYIIDGYRKGFIDEDKFKLNSLFFDQVFSPYLRKHEENNKKESDWELIDDLAECNILMFKNKQTGIIDVINLSQQKLDVVPKYSKGKTNVLGEYKLDSEVDMLYGDMGGIEAIKTLVLLNQIIEKIPNAKLGTLKVVSQFGEQKRYDIKYTVNQYLREIFRIVKKEVKDLPEISFNFKDDNFSDTIDNIINEYHLIMDSLTSDNQKKFYSENIGLQQLEDSTTIEGRRVALYSIAKQIQIQGFFKRNENIEDIANNSLNPRLKNLAKLYLLVSNAYLNYSGENLEYNAPMSELHTYVTTAPTVSSSNVRIVINNLQTTLDSISENIESEYTKHMRSFLMDFYKESGYSSIENLTIGDQNRLFKNMFQDNDRMLFKNPYDTSNNLTPPQRKFLKRALFEFNRIRQLRRNDIKQFTSAEDPAIADYISNNPNGERYLWVPLKRASKTTRRQDIKAYANNFKKKLQTVLKMNSEQMFDEFVNELTPEERATLNQDINDLNIHNPMLEWEKDSILRQDRINKLGKDYFETNVEDLLLNFLAKSVEVDKFEKFLVGTKMLMMQLELLGRNEDSIKTELKYIEDYLKVNVFQASVTNKLGQNIIGALTPLRTIVTYANLAGNAVAYLRDIENGFLENFLRTASKFQTDISASNLSKAYAYVVTHGSSNAMNINMLSKLCVRYRLSNTDLARITERLKTNRSGLFNWDNGAFFTLRGPDFLNRMTMFVAKAMQDGCFDAWYIENDELKYNWKKDKRFSIYAQGEKMKDHPEYKKQKALYILKIKEWNNEHPDKPLEYSDNLPSPYSNQEIIAIKNVSNNIYGSYDRSLRGMGENKALGWLFGMYTTWMNGTWNNWFMKPGKYNIHQQKTVQEMDENNNPLWLDEHGRILVEKTLENGNKVYLDENGNEGTPDVPKLKHVPVIVQGILYTFEDMLKVFKNGGINSTKEYLRGNDVAQKNIRHAFYQLLILLLHLALLKLATDAYKDHKKHAKEYSIAENLMAEIGYKSFKQAGDSFKGPYNIIEYVGNSNTPLYKVPTRLIIDAGKFVFGDKTFTQFITGNFAIARSFKETAALYSNSK